MPTFLKHPEKRLLFEIAERLGRTVGELLHGSNAYRPLTSVEFTDWAALFKLRAYEQEQAQKKAKSKR